VLRCWTRKWESFHVFMLLHVSYKLVDETCNFQFQLATFVVKNHIVTIAWSTKVIVTISETKIIFMNICCIFANFRIKGSFCSSIAVHSCKIEHSKTLYFIIQFYWQYLHNIYFEAHWHRCCPYENEQRTERDMRITRVFKLILFTLCS
jgi:hypothetical protein